MEPPIAERRPVEHVQHGVRRVDDYAWLRDASDPQVLAYLRAERSYYDANTAHSRPLQEVLFSEMSRRTPAADSSVSWSRGGPVYYTRSVPGKEYAQFCTSDRDLHGDGEDARILLDLNEVAEGHDYAELGVCEPSPDGRLLAWSVDTEGSELYALRIRDLTTGVDGPVIHERSYDTCAWTADSAALLYTVVDEVYRPCEVRRHDLGHASGRGGPDRPDGTDTLVLTEPDQRYELTVRLSRSREVIFIQADSRDDSQTWWLPSTGGPDQRPAPEIIWPAEPGIDYRVDHRSGPDGGELLAVTNRGASEFRVVRTPFADRDPNRWTDLVPGDAATRWETAGVVGDWAVVTGRRDAEPFLALQPLDGRPAHEIHPDGPAGRLVLERHDDPGAASITVRIESLVAPPRWLSIDLATGDRTEVKRLDVDDFDAGDYVTERFWATAADGTNVPVALARHRDTPLDGTAPCLLWAYGAYESCDWPEFDPAVISLLDRGVVYALAHPRGGGERGRWWWEQGRRESKDHTFGDVAAVADALAGGVVDGDRIVTRGLSAGGLLQGVLVTRRPERWAAVVAEVPFVDVVTSMLDSTVPLTISEWDEWGDPRRPEDFAWMLAYSPYDNEPVGPRPPMLVTGSRHDPRVLVHEPAKWVAKLRAGSTEQDGQLLFRVELGAGAHVGPAGRYGHLLYEAEVLAFVLEALGLAS